MSVESSTQVRTASDALLLKTRETFTNAGRIGLRVEAGAVSVYACSGQKSGHTTRRFLWVVRPGNTAVWCGRPSEKDSSEDWTSLELIADEDSTLIVLPEFAVSAAAAGIWLNQL